MYQRNLLPRLRDALADSPVVLVQGARQTGKTTVVEMLGEEIGAAYQTFDLATTLAAARSDPGGFLAAHGDKPLILDEVQRFPELFLPMKVEVDRGRRPGRFLLTGSASILALPRLSESLAGRMQILTLWPLSQGEIYGTPDGFIDALFDPSGRWLDRLRQPTGSKLDLIGAGLQGGYPDRIGKSPSQNRAWFQSYLSTILERDVRDIADIQAPADLLRLLSLLGTRVGSLLNYADLSRDLGMVDTTLKRYLALLEKVFLVLRLPAWATNLDKRVAKSPKLYLNDSGLFAHLMGIDRDRLKIDPRLSGPLVENFMFMELVKQIGWSEIQPAIYHFRTTARQEVDFVLERPGGQIVGIEVKAAANVSTDQFKGLHALKKAAGDRFLRGLVLYAGRDIVPFGGGMWAVPSERILQASGSS